WLPPITRYAMLRSAPDALDTEQRPRPLHENVAEQRQQREHEQPADQHDLARKAADLLLAGHGALLELQRAVGHVPVFGQVLALRVANLAQELLDLVAFHSKRLSALRRGLDGARGASGCC